MNVNKMLLQNSYELVIGVQSFTVDLAVAKRRFDWLEISLVYNKSEKRTTIYDGII